MVEAIFCLGCAGLAVLADVLSWVEPKPDQPPTWLLAVGSGAVLGAAAWCHAVEVREEEHPARA